MPTFERRAEKDCQTVAGILLDSRGVDGGRWRCCAQGGNTGPSYDIPIVVHIAALLWIAASPRSMPLCAQGDGEQAPWLCLAKSVNLSVRKSYFFTLFGTFHLLELMRHLGGFCVLLASTALVGAQIPPTTIVPVRYTNSSTTAPAPPPAAEPTKCEQCSRANVSAQLQCAMHACKKHGRGAGSQCGAVHP